MAGLALLLIATAAGPAVAQESDSQPEPATATDQTDDPAREVSVGLYLADLVEITGSSQSFLADVIMVISWNDPELVGAFASTRTINASDVWHPQLLIVNQRAVSKSLPEIVTVDPDGSVRYFQRYTGTFSAVMDLRDFPLDGQRLHVWVVAPHRFGEPLQLGPDSSLANLKAVSLSISDWRVLELGLAERGFRATANAIPAPGVELTVEVQRRVGYYIIQVIIPLIAIMLMAWAVFWIPPATIPPRIGVVVTTMLTLIAYRFALANDVPRLSYLTRLDWFLLVATTLVILTLFTMAYSAYLVSIGKEETVRRIDRVGRILYPTAVAAFTAVVWLL